MHLSTIDELLSAGALADDPTNTLEGWHQYAAWSASLGGQDFTVDDGPTASRFTAAELCPWDQPSRCPVCGVDMPPQAAVCEACIRDAATIEEPCSVCGDPADHWAGLCGPCLLAAITEDDERTARILREQTRWNP